MHQTSRFLKITLPALIAFVYLHFSCSKEVDYNTPVSSDKTKPGVVSNVKVTNFKGGAFITYQLPKTGNVLYVKASYIINDATGKSRETKSSYYSDTITVEGFAQKKEYEVKLTAVSRADVSSDVVTVKVNPDTPVYQLVAKTIKMQADFGGVNVQTANPYKKPVGAILLYKAAGDPKYGIYQQNFSDFTLINFSARGFDTLPKAFATYVTDQWGNNSDTVYQTIRPLFEKELDKSKFFENRLSSDTKIGFGWSLSNLWNGNSGGTGWHTVQENVPLPIIATFGLGVSAKLSRFILYGRSGYEYGHGNPKVFSIWGSDNPAPADAVLPVFAEVGTVLGDWVNMGNFAWPGPPSGAPPTAATAADKAFFNKGSEFTFPFTAPRARFLRLAVAESWSGATFAHAMEITVFGNTK
ncbi:DUF4959 domain-containing protein [Chitinophaga oryzae]|uniref:DUF4959 domain-containing protein n=1 Tax=Chitinophaga oryzae TaxID=2725414 RepID=A0ABX6LCC4_9BACT|nr:DUF4959 domain-containing protein [Chitinophaga oryzae]QJB37605.1 DUF4959 domain-containing protein [Chitinophaga oryzae]